MAQGPAGTENFWGYLPSLLANVLSCMACIWLIFKLHLLRGQEPKAHLGLNDSENVQRRIFPRQFWSLAIADIFYHAGLASHAFLGLVFEVLPVPSAFESAACATAWAVFTPARFISVLHELHIAVYCLCIAFRWRGLLLILGNTIPMLWALGLVLGVLNIFIDPWVYDEQQNMCTHRTADILTIVVVLTCGALSLVGYLCVFLRSFWPGRIKRSSYQRLAFYPLNFLLTYAMMMLAYALPFLYRPGLVFFIADFMESLNGLLNVAVYWGQSHYAAHCLILESRALFNLPSADAVDTTPQSTSYERSTGFRMEEVRRQRANSAPAPSNRLQRANSAPLPSIGPVNTFSNHPRSSNTQIIQELSPWARRLEALAREHAVVEKSITEQDGGSTGSSLSHELMYAGSVSG